MQNLFQCSDGHLSIIFLNWSFNTKTQTQSLTKKDGRKEWKKERKKKRKSKFKLFKKRRIASEDQETDRADSQSSLYSIMSVSLCWTLAAVTEKEPPLSLLWSSGQQHALLFVFQMPLWVRPLVYAQSACYNFPFTEGLWISQRNVKLPSFDFFFWPSSCRSWEMGFIVSETSSVMSRRWVIYKQYVALSPAFTQSGAKLSHLASSRWKTQSAAIVDEADHSLAQPRESYLLQVITQLSVNTVTGDTML